MSMKPLDDKGIERLKAAIVRNRILARECAACGRINLAKFHSDRAQGLQIELEYNEHVRANPVQAVA